MNLPEYRQHVRSNAAKRDGTPIYNASVEHAAIVIEYLFANAKKTVDILSGNLTARVYAHHTIIEQALLFLSSAPENKLRIILENDLPQLREIHPFFKACAGFEKVELRIAPKDLQEKYDFHFIVTDKDNYRFEFDKKKPSAIAAFGHEEGAENLAGIYDRLWERCEAADLIPQMA